LPAYETALLVVPGSPAGALPAGGAAGVTRSTMPSRCAACRAFTIRYGTVRQALWSLPGRRASRLEQARL